MYNPKYVINKSLGNKQITYPTMIYNMKEVPIKLIRLMQAMPIREFLRFHNLDIIGRTIYWTNDNVDDITLNLSKPLTKESYTIVDIRRINPPMINPFESDINCEKKKIQKILIIIIFIIVIHINMYIY